MGKYRMKINYYYSKVTKYSRYSYLARKAGLSQSHQILLRHLLYRKQPGRPVLELADSTSRGSLPLSSNHLLRESPIGKHYKSPRIHFSFAAVIPSWLAPLIFYSFWH